MNNQLLKHLPNRAYIAAVAFPLCAVALTVVGCGGTSHPMTGVSSEAATITRAATPSPGPTPPAAPRDLFPGKVARLVAATSFDLLPPPPPPGAPSGQTPPTLHVTFTAGTAIVDKKGNTATLTEELCVAVTGKLDTKTQTVAATKIEVQPPPPVNGPIVSIDPATVTFQLQAPPPKPGATGPILKVLTTASTVIVKVKPPTGPPANPPTPPTYDSAKFTDLKTKMPVAVFGPVDKNTNTVQADRIEILPPPKP